MVSSVPLAFQSANRACIDASPKNTVHHESVPAGRSREGTRRELAHVRAGKAARDARAQFLDVILSEV
jgi:hypothetical protein